MMSSNKSNPNFLTSETVPGTANQIGTWHKSKALNVFSVKKIDVQLFGSCCALVSITILNKQDLKIVLS